MNTYSCTTQDQRVRLFIDIDGTLAKWENKTFEELLEPGFYRSLSPNQAVVDAAKIIIHEYASVIETFSLSACLKEAITAKEEKNEWLDEKVSVLDPPHRLFCPCGTDKSLVVPGGIRPTDVLLDDYSHNLHLWKGRGLKLKNGINGTKGTWSGAAVDASSPARELAEHVVAHCLKGVH